MNLQEVLLTKDNYTSYKKAIKSFTCKRLNSGERFLKDCKSLLRTESDDRIYLILNTDKNDIVAFFSLKAFAVFFSSETDCQFSYPCIKINWFLTNDKYALTGDGHGSNMGSLIFQKYIYPTVKTIQHSIGVTYLILFSVNNPKVISSYQKMGFHFITDDDGQEDRDVSDYIRCRYEKNCKLMYMNLRSDI